MITQLDKLRMIATRTIHLRGHKMPAFDDWLPIQNERKAVRRVFEYVCPACGRCARIDTRPPPNGIDISGEAVALYCGDRS